MFENRYKYEEAYNSFFIQNNLTYHMGNLRPHPSLNSYRCAWPGDNAYSLIPLRFHYSSPSVAI